MTIDQFLTWVLNSGGSVAICSWIAEQIPQFQGLESNLKKWIFFFGSILISVTSYCVLTYVPAEILKVIEPFFMIVYVAFITNFAGESFHRITK